MRAVLTRASHALRSHTHGVPLLGALAPPPFGDTFSALGTLTLSQAFSTVLPGMLIFAKLGEDILRVIIVNGVLCGWMQALKCGVSLPENRRNLRIAFPENLRNLLIAFRSSLQPVHRSQVTCLGSMPQHAGVQGCRPLPWVSPQPRSQEGRHH